ncbi:PTS fructose transporter subunit IIA [Deltaproteobacteria bacterium Smac51]|nr:PTS fructose transporter subunit IIA [Deltaproteobacteria bacterium Smac51]
MKNKDITQGVPGGDFSLQFLWRFKNLFENPVLMAIREGLTFSLPIIVAGTMAVLLNSFPLPAYQKFMVELFGPEWKSFGGYIWNGTLGVMSLVMAVSIANRLAEHYNYANPASRINGSTISLITLAALVVTLEPGNLTSEGGSGLPVIWLGVHGLLWATFIALGSGYLFRWLLRFRSLRLNFNSGSSDTTMGQAMDTLIPGIITIIVFAAIKYTLRVLEINDINASIYQLIYKPFSSLGDNMLETASIYGVARHLLWFLGIHGSNVLEPIMTELYAPGVLMNQAALARGAEATQIFTKPFFDCYTSIGGSGSTLGLLIACLLRHNDNGTRRIARISVAPALFNINEILLFGLPVVLNPVFLVPFLLVPLVQTAIAYIATITGLVPVTINDVAWNVPIFISGYMATGSAAGIVLQLVCLLAAIAIYLPFVTLDDWLRAERFSRTFSKLVRVSSESDVASAPVPRFLSSSDNVGNLARFLANDLEIGLQRGEIYLEYQPQVDSRNGRVYGVEALCRWRHPQVGAVPPSVFISLAEESGFIKTLGLWILDEACRQGAEWRKTPGAEKVVISVNVSGRQLEDIDLPEKVEAILAKHSLPESKLKIEVTESIAISGPRSGEVLARFSQAGIKLAMDDFGMGHTSLAYIKAFHLDSLKLDSMLSRDVLSSRDSREIIASIADLCRSLNIELIAEFVEDEAQVLMLRELGCYNIQGYIYSPSLKPDDCLRYILDQHQVYGDPYDGSDPDNR